MARADGREWLALAVAGDGIWHSVAYVPLLFRSNFNSELLD